MNAIRVSWLFLKLGVLNELQYRVNFFVSLLQAAIALVTGLVVLSLVYSHTEELNGWSKSELLCVLGVQILMGGAIRTYIQPNMTRLIEDVRDGKLDFALTKPQDAQVLVSVREVRIWSAVDIVSGFVVLAVGLSRVTTSLGPADAAYEKLQKNLLLGEVRHPRFIPPPLLPKVIVRRVDGKPIQPRLKHFRCAELFKGEV